MSLRGWGGGRDEAAAMSDLYSLVNIYGFFSADSLSYGGNSTDYHFKPSAQNYPHNPLGYNAAMITDPDNGEIITQAGWPRISSLGPKFLVGAVNTNRATVREGLQGSSGATAAARAHTLWYNLTKSYIINSTSAQDVEDKGEEYFDPFGNIAKNILGDASNADNSLGDTDNSKKLAQILRWPSTANTVYPFERPNMKFSGELTDSASGIEKWFDENIGNILEERGTDFRGLDNFVDSFDEIVNALETKVSVFSTEGHGQLIINEIIRALRGLFTGDITEFHPQPGYSEKKVGAGMLFSPSDFERMTMVYSDPVYGPLPDEAVDAKAEEDATETTPPPSDAAVGDDSMGAEDSADTVADDADAVYDNADAADDDGMGVTDGSSNSAAIDAADDDDGDAAADAGGNSCFVAGTVITTVNDNGIRSKKTIEDIVPGNIVLTYNFANAKFESKQVLDTVCTMHDDIVEFVFSNGVSSRHTFDHPYFVRTKGWASHSPEKTINNYAQNSRDLIETSRISIGDQVLNDDGSYVRIIEINEIATGPIKTYTFSVHGNRNYFADGILVHNKAPPSGDTAFDGIAFETRAVDGDGIAAEDFVVVATETNGALATNNGAGDVYFTPTPVITITVPEGAEEPGLIASRDHFFTKLMTFLHLCRQMKEGQIDASIQTFLIMGSIVGEHVEVRGTHGTYSTNNFDGSQPAGIYRNAVSQMFSFSDGATDGYSDQEAKSVVIHAQELFAAVCCEIEKNIAYDIGVLCNDKGLVPRSVGAYEDKIAIGILNTIFASAAGNMGLIYGDSLDSSGDLTVTTRFKAHTAPIPATSATNISLESFGSGIGPISNEDAKVVLHHLQLRTEIVHIIGDIASRLIDDLPKDEFNIPGGSVQFAPVYGSFSPRNAEAAQVDQYSGGMGITRRLALFTPDAIADLNAIKFKLAAQAELAKMFLPLVDNTDPEAGPVRWKLSHGSWTEQGVDLEASDFVNRDFIPQSAVDIVNQGASAVTAEIAQSIGVGPSASAADNIARGLRLFFGFLLKQEDIIPYTFVDNKEIPQFPYTIDPVRGPASGITKACVFFREDTRRLLLYLKSVVSHYKAAKDNMVGLSEDPNGSDLVDRAKLHGVEATEIIKYSSTRQTFLRSFLLSEESGLRTSAYTPSSNYASKRMNNDKLISILNEALVSNACLTTPTIDFFNLSGILLGRKMSLEPAGEAALLEELAEKFEDRTAISEQFSDVAPVDLLEDGKILTIGIPAGLTDFNSKADSLSVFERFYVLEQNNDHFFTGEGKALQKVYRVFWPSLFVNRVELMEAIANSSVSSFRDLVHSCNYGIVDPVTGNYIVQPYSAIVQRMETIITSAEGGAGLRNADNAIPYDFNVEVIIANHVLDELLGLYLDFYAGLNTTESSFSVNLNSNLLYLDETAMDNIDMIVSFVPGLESADHILDDDKIVKFKTFFSRQNAHTNKEQAFETYSVFASIIQSRLFSADQMSTMVLVPNIFDRTFNIFTHMGQLFYDDNTMFDFTDEFSPDTLNALANDYNSQVYFRGYNT